MNTHEFSERLLSMQANLLNFAYTLTNSRDKAYDLLQDTTMNAMNNSSQYIDESNFKGWVFTIMRDIFVKQYRRKINVVQTSANCTLGNMTGTMAKAHIRPEGSISAQQLNECIAVMDDRLRRPFVMHITGYRVAEIASELDIPVKAIIALVLEARDRFRSLLG